MKKIAFVIHRYGTSFSGGAEYECRALAEHMKKYYSVDVLTSCAVDTMSWHNELPEGEEWINGIRVMRFPVEHRRSDAALAQSIAAMRAGQTEAHEGYIREFGPYCPGMIEWLGQHRSEYEAVVFFTYLYAPTIMGMGLGLPNAILVPAAHDEPTIRLPVYRDVFQNASAILFNSYEEKELCGELFDLSGKPDLVTCVGVDIPKLAAGIETDKEYVIYVGRVSRWKGYYELNAFFTEYKRQHPSPLKLVVIGTVDEGAKLTASKDIIYKGFVSEEEKTRLVSGAKALIMPSYYESLSLVILEAMAVQTPILVNGDCAVLKGQCRRSNAGLYYRNYFEFDRALSYILENKDVREQMGQNGLGFVRREYEWDTVTARICGLIEGLHDEEI